MKNFCAIAVVSTLILTLSGCADVPAAPAASPASPPETVLITYHVKAGKEADFEGVLDRAWKVYQSEHLVFDQPHVIVRGKEKEDKTYFIEIFTWVSHDAPDHAPDSVKNIWNEMLALCEARDGHNGLEGGEVDLLAPKSK